MAHALFLDMEAFSPAWRDYPQSILGSEVHLSLEDTSSIRRDDTTLASWWGSEEALAQERRSFPDLSALRCPPCAVQTSADSGTLAGPSA